jgi:hypothetical protein
MVVNFTNHGGFVASFSIQWNGGESGRTGPTDVQETVSIDTSSLNIPDGESCWARAYINAGPNHDSGDNFTFHQNGGLVTYTISGTTFDPSFSCDGCN